MRIFIIAASTMAFLAGFTPAFALQAHDPMSSWKSAPSQERTELLRSLSGNPTNDAQRAAIAKCLDEASGVPGHADLEIGEIVKACVASGNMGEPV